MVSGFLTSPLDQDRMESGDATEITTYSTWLTLSRPSNSRALSLVLIIISFCSNATTSCAESASHRSRGQRPRFTIFKFPSPCEGETKLACPFRADRIHRSHPRAWPAATMGQPFRLVHSRRGIHF